MADSARRLVSRLFSVLRDSSYYQSNESKSLMTLRGEIRRLRAKVDRYKADEHATRERNRRLRSMAVDSRHLRSVLPLRAAALRDSRDETAAAREAEFLAHATAYADVKSTWINGHRPEGVRATTTAGLQWSIPQDNSDEHSLAHRLERGWLPLHDIATVRSCAVGGVMLDVGANIGTTCIPRVVLGDFDCVYAAEPEAENYACLVGNVIDNGLEGRVLPERLAITSWTGEASLEKSERIGAHRLTAAPARVHGEVAEVPCSTIDKWLERLRVSPAAVTFVKVDTQGWDVEVLKGAASLLSQKHIVWQIEITRMVKRSGATVERFLALLSEHFTHARRLDGKSATIRPIVEVLSDLQQTLEENSFVNLLLLNRA